MKPLSEFKNIYLYREAIDMRKAINGLSVLIEQEGVGDLFSPSLFVFTGKRRDSIKIIYFDRSGFALWQKKLEKDKFPWPRKWPDKVVTVTSEQLQWLLDGYDVWTMKPFESLSYSRVI